MRVCWCTHLIGSISLQNSCYPSIGDIKFSNINFDHSCAYMNKKYAPNTDWSKYLAELKTYCNKIKPFVSHYSNLIRSYHDTVYNILENEIKTIVVEPKISHKEN